jgi:3-deoxy-D-manno-octulosonic-acid transferase
MMSVLYETAIFLYHLMIRMIAPYNKKAMQFYSGRKNWLSILKASVDRQSRYIWFHCASLGEFEQGRPVIEAIRNEFPQFKLVLSFFSPSGYEIRKNYPMADVVCYLPADTKRNAAQFIDTIHPEKVFFVKYEFWFNYIITLQKRNIPLYLISGIFRKNQRFFSKMPWGTWFRRSLSPFTFFFVQDQSSADLLAEIGFLNCTISGDTRFDRVAAISKSSKLFPLVDKFTEGKPVLIAGSTWKRDEELIVPYINEQKGLKYIIAPHEVTPQNLNRLVQILKKPTVFFSRISEKNILNYEVIIVDSIGILSSLYRYGSFAYIGGGFGLGIHNILEAATFGLPVFFGPNYGKFREACQLVEKGAAFTVDSTDSFRKGISRLIENPADLKKASEISLHYVKQNQGATAVILQKAFT